jgi:hypothetical protein
MRALGSLLTLGIFALAAGCGSSSGGGGTGGSGQGGNIGIDGGGGIGGGDIDATGAGGSIDAPATGGDIDAPATGGIDGPATGGIDSPATGGIDGEGILIDSSGGGPMPCNYPSCAAAVVANCQPEGTCVRQASGLGAATCFSNGVSVVSGIDTTTLETTMTYKSAGKTCYSIAIAGMTTATPTYTFKDGAGVVLGGGGVDMTTGTLTFACAGGTNVDLGCSLATLIAASGATASCSTGVCTP